jgi:hypothetical protein
MAEQVFDKSLDLNCNGCQVQCSRFAIPLVLDVFGHQEGPKYLNGIFNILVATLNVFLQKGHGVMLDLATS